MKRYRVLGLGFDSRPWILGKTISESWDSKVQESWRDNQRNIREAVLEEYGRFQGESKVRNFIDFGRIPFSVLSYHNRFVTQIQRAFVVGAYYPALTGACALGERVLNHLVILLREEFRKTPEYRRVHSKSSFDDWELAISTLEAWDVLVAAVAADFRELRNIRNRAIHYRPEVDVNDRPIALEAAHCLLRIVAGQFGPDDGKPWTIPNTPGELFIKKQAETLPFVKHVYLPNCELVGPLHRLARGDEGWSVDDDHVYEDREISDEEFRELRTANRASSPPESNS
jgi:hypothetical protein